MCLSAQSKTLASHNQLGGEKGNGNKEDTLRGGGNPPTSTFCHAFFLFTFHLRGVFFRHCSKTTSRDLQA